MPKTDEGYLIIDIPLFTDAQIEKINELSSAGKEEELKKYIESITNEEETKDES